MSYELKTKKIELGTFLLIGEIQNSSIIDSLISFIKNNKENNSNCETAVQGHFTGFKSLVDNKNFHEFLKLIQPSIYKIYKKKFIIYEAWGNICELNDEILEHNHNGITAFCGIIYLTEGGPGTFFKNFNLTVKEKVGRYVLFHPLLLHSVEKNTENKERITIAFNMNEFKGWEKEKIKFI